MLQIRGALKQAKIVPIEDSLLSRFPWFLLPLRQPGLIRRSLALALLIVIIYGGTTLAILYGFCSHGAFLNSGEDCMISAHAYIFLKGTWAAVCGMIVYPLVLISAINRANLPPKDYAEFLRQQKIRVETETAIQNQP